MDLYFCSRRSSNMEVGIKRRHLARNILKPSKNLYCNIWTFKQGYLTMKLIQRGLFRLCFSTIVLIKIKTRYIFKKAVRLAPSFEGFVASLKNLQYNFPKMRGGGQRLFGTFPKIHLFWKGKASLTVSFMMTQSSFINC